MNCLTYLVVALPSLLLCANSKCQDLSEFVLHPDCKIELVASEPNVVDPIAIRFDEKGRMWVVEMRDYPTLKDGSPTSKIKILQDNDQDGVFETATVFADQLLFPTGLQPWKNGVIVTLEGKIVYLADNDGDLVCDEEIILFTGFAKQNTQLRANHPTFGPDGNIYVANGLRNGSISNPISASPISISGMDFRFDPTSNQCEPVTGYGQFGLTFDAMGNRYTCTNRNPLKRIVFENEYLALAKGIPIAPAVHDVASAGPESRLFPIGETWTTSNLHANQFTAACGVHIFLGDHLPNKFIGDAFTCDPTANLVHREIIDFEANEITGVANPARKGVEFLASTDSSFRPVNLTTGPDGALYIVDMRRAVIEHPDFMPSELKHWPDLKRGDALGRIYRIVPNTARKPANRRLPKFNSFSDAVEQLRSGNAWATETAHRLIIQGRWKIEFDQLEKLLSSKHLPQHSLIRVQNILHRNGRIDVRNLSQEVTASNVGVVRANVIQAELSGGKSFILQSLSSKSQLVRFQSLLSAAKLQIELDVSLLKQLAFSDCDNLYMRSAILLASKTKHADLFASILANVPTKKNTNTASGKPSSGLIGLCVDLAGLVAQRASPQELSKFVEDCLSIKDSTLHKNVAAQLLLTAQKRAKLHKVKTILQQSPRFKSIADNIAVNTQNDPTETSLAIYAMLSPDTELLERLAIHPANSQQRLTAIKSCHLLDGDAIWLKLVDSFRSENSNVRGEVLKAAVQRKSVAIRLLTLIQSGKIKVYEIDASSRKALLASRFPEVKSLAQSNLVIKISEDRNAALKKYLPAIEFQTSAKRGKPIFEKTCAACHQLGKLGNRIGPDISDTRTKSKTQLLRDILMPNAAIDNNFIAYYVESLDGRSYSGIIIEETIATITIQQANNMVVKLDREDIEQVASSGKSIMPIGLEQGITPQQMADLLSFLKNWRYLEQNIPFNESNNAK